jgi:hypothetical protein
MRFSRPALALLLVLWIAVVLYPDPNVLWNSIQNIRHPDVDAAAVAGLARQLPSDPRLIEAAVQQRIVPYAYDWQVNGVPWYFPTTAQVLRAGRGDCESRAIVLASILKAKGIPYQLRMSFDHIWVDYPGKRPNAIENDSLVLAERQGGHFVFHWPKQFHLRQEVSDQLAVYWTPMPDVRKGLLLAGLLIIPLFNSLAALAGRLGGWQAQLPPAAAPGRRRGLTVGPQRV